MKKLHVSGMEVARSMDTVICLLSTCCKEERRDGGRERVGAGREGVRDTERGGEREREREAHYI